MTAATVPWQPERITLRVSGWPVGKQRPRFDPRTKRAYTPAATTASENDIRAVWREAGEPHIAARIAVELDLRITVTRPASHFRKDGTLSAEGLRHPIPQRKPDVDNALKLVMDALNGRAYRDDVQISDALVSRRWGDRPEILVTLRPIAAISQLEER